MTDAAVRMPLDSKGLFVGASSSLPWSQMEPRSSLYGRESAWQEGQLEAIPAEQTEIQSDFLDETEFLEENSDLYEGESSIEDFVLLPLFFQQC